MDVCVASQLLLAWGAEYTTPVSYVNVNAGGDKSSVTEGAKKALVKSGTLTKRSFFKQGNSVQSKYSDPTWRSYLAHTVPSAPMRCSAQCTLTIAVHTLSLCFVGMKPKSRARANRPTSPLPNSRPRSGRAANASCTLAQ